MEVIKNILHVKGLLKCPWAKVTNTIVHVLNKTMTKVLDGLTTFEKWAWSTPNISYF
jgi:phenolic acid decarboxylase